MRGRPRTGATTVVTAVATIVAAAGCHVRATSELTTPIATERVLHPEGAIARRPTIVWTEAGELRFVEPLECPSEELVRQRTAIETQIRPNLATFTVGVIAASVGGVLLTSGLFASDRGSNPLTYAGLAGLAVGLPFAIGPWLGDRTERSAPRDASAPVRRPGPSQPCGDRPLAARAATLEVSGLEIRGAVDRDGRFAISPYQWIDAYNAGAVPAVALAATIDGTAPPSGGAAGRGAPTVDGTAPPSGGAAARGAPTVDGTAPPSGGAAARGAPTVDGNAGARTLAAVLDSQAIASHAAAYLAQHGVSAIAPLRLVPGLVPGPLRASLVTTPDGDALRVELALRNDGPGDASGVRGQIVAPAVPAVDGRMIYVGTLARGAAVSRAAVIPLTASAASALRGHELELSVELRDAHGTAPTTPVKLRATLRSEPAP